MSNKIFQCRICESDLNDKDLIIIKNAPNSAQNFLKLNSKINNSKINLIVKECTGCGVVQTINKPVNYHKNVIRTAGFSPSMKKFRLNQLTNLKMKYNLQNEHILEIGSGRGDYLSILSKVFKNAYGIEKSFRNYIICKKKKLKIFNCYLNNKNYKITKRKFGAFFIFSFLEHIPKINILLKSINNNLKEDAIGVIEVPNFEMMIQKKLYSEFISDHIFYFTKKTLKIALEINGFEIIDLKSIWNNYIIHAEVKKRQPLQIKNWKKNFYLIEKKINNFLSTYKKNECAIWSAGHQSLTILSQMNYKKKFKYIVDSAPFKQNRFAPGLNIKVVSPETMFKDKIKAVVILAAGFSKEIYKIVKKKNNNIKILYQKKGLYLSK